MKHASHKTLESLDNVLRQLREHRALVERTPGSFYFKSKAFLHFHEDPAGLFADVKLDGTRFERLCINTKPEQDRFVEAVENALPRIKNVITT